jgi:hypothetical protein
MKMKKNTKLFFVCCFVIIARTQTNAQKQLDCDSNFKEALSFVQLSQNFKKDSIKVINLLKPCLKVRDAKAQLLMGRLYATRKDEKGYKKAFKLFKKAAKQGNAVATGDLGAMYKYGRGCNLNLNKARKWFKKGAELGNIRATYSLGYLYLKGFGNIDQDYSKAVKWFEKSEHAMAKYWLGVCYYYGYGVQKNIQKANELLGSNFENAVTNNEGSRNADNSIDNISDGLNIDKENSIISEEVSENTILGKWSGSLLKYDWSGKHIEQKFPINIQFNSENDTSTYLISIENQELQGNLSQIDDAIYFEDTQMNLPHISFKEEIPNEIDYQILSSNLVIKNLGETNYLIGSLETYIEGWNEAGAPLKFVLKKKETFANSDEELSDDVLQAFADQEESFIKLYPNPFESDLIISYTLETKSFVEVRITDINGTKNKIIEKGKEHKAGKHTYFFNGINLEKGIYVVTVIANNQKKTRIIVKK